MRCKTHFTTLSNGVEVILGLNGYIWVSKRSLKQEEDVGSEELYSYQNEVTNTIK